MRRQLHVHGLVVEQLSHSGASGAVLVHEDQGGMFRHILVLGWDLLVQEPVNHHLHEVRAGCVGLRRLRMVGLARPLACLLSWHVFQP